MACQIGLFRGLGLLGPDPVGLLRGLGLLGPDPVGLFRGLGLLGPNPVLLQRTIELAEELQITTYVLNTEQREDPK